MFYNFVCSNSEELEYHDLMGLFEFLDNGDGEITSFGYSRAVLIWVCIFLACSSSNKVRMLDFGETYPETRPRNRPLICVFPT